MSDDERVYLDPKEALERLNWDDDCVHVASNPAVDVIVGADWDRPSVEQHFTRYQPQLSGPIATEMHHGIYCGGYFFETRPEMA